MMCTNLLGLLFRQVWKEIVWMFKLVLAYADGMLMTLSTDESVKILKHMCKAAGSKISLRAAICLMGLTNRNR